MMEIVFFIFGAVLGSFLNVCIVRLPQEKSLVFPGSNCVHCSKPIAWFDNIPLLSWLILGGKCRQCRGSISFRYWVVELLTGLLFAAFYHVFGPQSILAPYLVMLCCFIVATFVDFAHRIIPDEVSVGGMFAGIFFSAMVPALHPEAAHDGPLAGFLAGLIVLFCLGLMLIYPVFCKHLMEDYDTKEDRGIKMLVGVSLAIVALINTGAHALPQPWQALAWSLGHGISGYIIGGGVIYAMGLLGDIIFKKESMGGGDVKLMAMIGAFMGWKLAVLTFFLAPFFGAAYGIIQMIRTKDNTMAYGPFLVLGALVSLFWGNKIIDWIILGGIYGS